MELEPRYFTQKEFKFESGEVLKDLKIEYTTLGNKTVDNNGFITNAILYLHGWSGDYTSIGNLEPVIGPGKAIDTNSFFIIAPTALGSPGSSSPSTSGLASKFPRYTVGDMVRAQKDFLSNGMKVKNLKGIFGTSMGGFQVLQWGVEYPDVMDFLIPNATSQRSTRQMYGAYGLMNSIIGEDPAYDNGNYSQNPRIALEHASTIGYLWSTTPEYFEEEFPNTESFLTAMKERNLEIVAVDANDLFWRNRAMLDFNVEEKISKIKAKTLVIGIKSDQIFPPSISTIPLYQAIPGAEIFLYDSILGHYGSVKDIQKAEQAIRDFFDEYLE